MAASRLAASLLPLSLPGHYRQSWEELTYSYGLRRRVAPLSSQNAVQQRYDEQSENGGNEESADHGATQGGVLFSAVAGSKGHWHHADDHGERGHTNGTQSGVARIDRRFNGGPSGAALPFGKGDQEHAVRGCYAHRHDRTHQRWYIQRRPGHEQHPDDSRCRAGERDD